VMEERLGQLCQRQNATETDRIQLVLFGMPNRTFGPYAAASIKTDRIQLDLFGMPIGELVLTCQPCIGS
jgi:hypothetical protein